MVVVFEIVEITQIAIVFQQNLQCMYKKLMLINPDRYEQTIQLIMRWLLNNQDIEQNKVYIFLEIKKVKNNESRFLLMVSLDKIESL